MSTMPGRNPRQSSIRALAKAEGEAMELRGNAERGRLVAEAEGKRAQIEAENQQSDALLRARLKPTSSTGCRRSQRR